MSFEGNGGILSSNDVFSVQLRSATRNTGYDADQVDDYLDEIVRVLAYYEALAQQPEAPVELDHVIVRGIDVRHIDFGYARGTEGYDPDQVDDFLDEAAATLEAYEEAYGIPAADDVSYEQEAEAENYVYEDYADEVLPEDASGQVPQAEHEDYEEQWEEARPQPQDVAYATYENAEGVAYEEPSQALEEDFGYDETQLEYYDAPTPFEETSFPEGEGGAWAPEEELSTLTEEHVEPTAPSPGREPLKRTSVDDFSNWEIPMEDVPQEEDESTPLPSWYPAAETAPASPAVDETIPDSGSLNDLAPGFEPYLSAPPKPLTTPVSDAQTFDDELPQYAPRTQDRPMREAAHAAPPTQSKLTAIPEGVSVPPLPTPPVGLPSLSYFDPSQRTPRAQEAQVEEPAPSESPVTPPIPQDAQVVAGADVQPPAQAPSTIAAPTHIPDYVPATVSDSPYGPVPTIPTEPSHAPIPAHRPALLGEGRLGETSEAMAHTPEEGRFVPTFLTGYRSSLTAFTSAHGATGEVVTADPQSFASTLIPARKENAEVEATSPWRTSTKRVRPATSTRTPISTAFLLTVTTSRPLGADDAVWLKLPDGTQVPITGASSDFNGVHLTIPE
ncbi:MAG: DivIVA domain-containing protein [Actinomycetaceae bacterium]|nr:DivIVA domain-containing protein [Actinomycetaceae bacterium]